MDKEESKRLEDIEKRIEELAREFGLNTTNIIFEIVSAKKILEASAYMFPVNFSHWTFGRDYDRARTIYEHTGQGNPYEVVWNFDTPKAYVAETNPFALKILTIAHVYAHVDFFLSSCYTQQGRSFSDIAEEARNAAKRFRGYSSLYGRYEVEKTIDAGMSIRWHEHPDQFMREELDNEIAKKYALERAREKLRRGNSQFFEFNKLTTKKNKEKTEEELRNLALRNPPFPIHDLLGYIVRHSSKLKDWQKDVLAVIRNQSRALSFNARTKLLNEGWATYWHKIILRRLFKEGLITSEEHGVYNDFNAKVTRESKTTFNVYMIGPSLFEYIKYRYDRGQFGKDYELCDNPTKKAEWNTYRDMGDQKIFEVRSFYSDRMAVEEFFTDEFIRSNKLFIYQKIMDKTKEEIVYVIAENRPEVIRRILKRNFSSALGTQQIVIQDSNYKGSGELYLKHLYSDTTLDPIYRDGTLRSIYYLWGRSVYLETMTNNNSVLCSYNGKESKLEKLK